MSARALYIIFLRLELRKRIGLFEFGHGFGTLGFCGLKTNEVLLGSIRETIEPLTSIGEIAKRLGGVPLFAIFKTFNRSFGKGNAWRIPSLAHSEPRIEIITLCDVRKSLVGDFAIDFFGLAKSFFVFVFVSTQRTTQLNLGGYYA